MRLLIAILALVATPASAQPVSGTTPSGLFYEASGAGEPLVLIHAFSVDRRMWAPQIAALEKHYRVVRYDLRGHGRSPGTSAPFTAYGDLRDVLDALKIPRATLVGLSAGSEVAINFALSYPDRVAGLALAAPGLGGYRVPPLPWATPVFEAASKGDTDAAAALWAETPIMALRSNSGARATVRALVMDNRHLWAMRRTEQPLTPPAVNRLGEIKVPVLVIVGDQDLPHIREIGSLIAAGVANGRLVVLPGAGHIVNLDATASFNDALTSFVTFDAPIAARLDRHRIPGAVAIVADGSRVLYRRAFGMADPSTATPMNADTIFRIASMTKPVTSVAAMQLIEQGRIGLDDLVSKYLPELERPPVFTAFNAATGAYQLRPAERAVTVRHLLTHTSGLGYTFTSATLRDFKPREGEQQPAGPLLFEPGARWHYGTSTDWVGRLVERVSGQNLETYFADHIFAPLGMRDTSYNVPEAKQRRVVTIHRRGADGTFVPQPAPFVQLAEFNGGGGLFSTADDYIRFLQMLLNDGEGNGARVLSKASVAAMSRNQIGNLGVPALATAMPERSANFAFINDGRDKWGLGFLITAAAVPGKRAPGSLSWGGINNTHFWIDRSRGVVAVILMQFLPFADPAALDVLDTFERGVYKFTSG